MGILIWAIVATFIVVVLANNLLDMQDEREHKCKHQEIVDTAPYKQDPASGTIKEETKTNYFYE